MIVVTCGSSPEHSPQFEFDGTGLVPAAETPGRVPAILDAVSSLPFVTVEEGPTREDWAESMPPLLERVHSGEYIEYLRSMKQALAGPTAAGRLAVYPSVFPFRTPSRAGGRKARAGTFCYDTYTPIFAGTFEAAARSFAASARAARVVSGGGGHAYALCRPPGHHAERGRCGGYCYFNNAAAAAEALAAGGAKVAVLDVDAHHGNGTQEIFWERADVLTVSLHGDPDELYPHFSGFAEETGGGAGLGMNLNLPLPLGTSDRTYQAALEAALQRIGGHRPNFLVIALGVDTHERDPLGAMALTTGYYRRMGAAICELKVPTVVVQEGGYNIAHIGGNVAAFLAGLAGPDG